MVTYNSYSNSGNFWINLWNGNSILITFVRPNKSPTCVNWMGFSGRTYTAIRPIILVFFVFRYNSIFDPRSFWFPNYSKQETKLFFLIKKKQLRTWLDYQWMNQWVNKWIESIWIQAGSAKLTNFSRRIMVHGVCKHLLWSLVVISLWVCVSHTDLSCF